MKKRLVRQTSDGFLLDKVKGVYDEHLIHREVYNPNKFSIIFTRNKTQDQYIFRSGIPLGPEMAVCKPDDFLHLPHGYYFAKASNGADLFNAIVNFGDSIGIGNKKPSLPIAETRKIIK